MPPKKYYIASLDLNKCFDNVDTALLYDLVYSLLHNSTDNTINENNDDNNDDNGNNNCNVKNYDNKSIDVSKGTDDEGYMVQRYSVSHYIPR
jgi:hypothetical protein